VVRVVHISAAARVQHQAAHGHRFLI
jgi:hypothetical protein